MPINRSLQRENPEIRLGHLMGLAALLVALFCAIPGLELSAAPLEDKAALGALSLGRDDGLITLQARDTPLAEVLQAIAAEAGFELTLRGDFDKPVTYAFSGVPLEAALKRLAGGHSIVMMRRSSDTADGAQRLTRVLISENRNAFVQNEENVVSGRRFMPSSSVAAQRLRQEISADLAQPEETTRLQAIGKLGQLPPGDAVEILAGVLAADDSPQVRRRALTTLSQLETEDVTPVLESALEDGNAGVRTQAISALDRMGGERATEVLGQVLLNNPDRRMRLIAARALTQQDTDEARAYLEAAASDPDPTVRSAVTRTSARRP